MTAPWDEARRLVQAHHWEQRAISDGALDRALGLDESKAHGSSSSDPSRHAHHAGESIVNVRSPYAVCRALFRQTLPTADDVVVDLGCGEGRVLLYGALATPARLRGIELVESRCLAARRAIERLALDRASVVHANVLSVDWTDGTIFYAFRPFSTDTEARVVARLHEIARRRPIAVVAHRLLPTLFDERLFERVGRGEPVIYRSRCG